MDQEHDQESHQQGGEQSQTGEGYEAPQVGTPKDAVHASNNTIVVVVLAVIIVVLALMYLWGKGLEQRVGEPTPPEVQVPLPPDAQTEVLRQVGTSDEIEAIEADLTSTELDQLDEGLEELEQELDAAIQ